MSSSPLWGPLVKRPWVSKTLIVNTVLLIVFAIGLISDSAGVFHLSAQLVAALGVVAAVLNFGLRLATNSAIQGTPAAEPQRLPAETKAAPGQS
jgi:hypothetical protein